MTCDSNTSRRALLGVGLVVLLSGLPSRAVAGDPFFVDVSQSQPGRLAPPPGDVLDTAAAEGQFRVLLRLIRVAGYEDTLRGPGPFTLFAPTDAAFARMPRAEFARLSEPRAHEDLLRLLAYHVVPSRITSADVSGRVRRMRTANGQPINVDGRDGLRVNDELVVLPDLNARNGVVHGVNAVLSPPVLVAAS